MDKLLLYLVVGYRPDHETAILAAIRGGVTMIQIRFKGQRDRDIIDRAIPIARLCQERSVPLIVNDRIDLALILGASGVHLGVDDLPLEDARRIAPAGFIIGYSPETDRQIAAAGERGASYLGVGPVYATATKLDAGIPLGLAEFQRRRLLTTLPVVGIGGITAGNAPEVMTHGADGVAVSSAILGKDDIELASRTIRNAIDQ